MKKEAIISLEMSGETREVEVFVYPPTYPDLEEEITEGKFIILQDTTGSTWSGNFGGTIGDEILIKREGTNTIGLNFRDIDKVVVPKIPMEVW